MFLYLHRQRSYNPKLQTLCSFSCSVKTLVSRKLPWWYAYWFHWVCFTNIFLHRSRWECGHCLLWVNNDYKIIKFKDKYVEKCNKKQQIWLINLWLRATRVISLFNVPVRTRRVLSLYKVYGDSTLLILNGTLLNSDSTLLSLSW